ncbi:MAG: UDP-3-O-(3-hydroxymyristoyl)glucosamine N-acyltransferase, partial [Muribaculaceae bacterium]|nr:UDP-3-O-(3-hydroxymyristoyl)glucosamine N-acyltransferase [Muribaculaceae bacterium]
MKITATELAAITKGRIEGDPKASVHTFAKIEEAGEGALTFLANPKYTHFLYNTGATIALVAEAFEAEHPLPPTLTLLRVENPYETLAQLMAMVNQSTALP